MLTLATPFEVEVSSMEALVSLFQGVRGEASVATVLHNVAEVSTAVLFEPSVAPLASKRFQAQVLLDLRR